MIIPTNPNLNSYQGQSKNEDIDWEAALQSLYTRRWFILTITALVCSLAVAFTAAMPDIYTAQTSILVERVDDTPLHYKEILFPAGEQGPGYYETKVALLKSRPILEETIKGLDLVEHYRKEDAGVKSVQDVLKILNKRIRANVLGRTQIIRVEIKDTNPEMAARIANTISENFVREAWRERFFISDQLLKWFPEEAGTLQKNTPIQQLRKLDTDEIIASLPSVMQDSILNGIKQDRMKIDAQIRELSRRYTAEHPKMKELRARGDYLGSELKAQIERIVSGLKAGLAGQFSVNNIKIVESATPPTKPSGPRRLLTVLGFTLVSLVLSAWSAVFLEYLNRHIRTEEDIKRLGVTFLGHMPLITGLGSTQNGKRLDDLIDSDMRLGDDVMNVRTSLLFSMPAEQGKLLLCTSAIPGEGKSTIAAMLGISLAESGMRVLLIDADMRNPTLHKIFHLENEEGLSGCLAGTVKAREAVQIMEKNTFLHVLPAGKKPPNPAVLIGSSAMGNLISELASEYDKIIFDVPPALHIADALILGQRMHGAILVFEAGKIHQTIAKRLIEKVSTAHGILIAAVVNRTKFQKLDSRAYQYYHQYQKYYHRPVGKPN